LFVFEGGEAANDANELADDIGSRRNNANMLLQMECKKGAMTA